MKFLIVLFIIFTTILHSVFTQEITLSGDTNLCIGQKLVLTASGDTSFIWVSANDPQTILSETNELILDIELSETFLVYTPTDTVTVNVVVNNNGCNCQYYLPNVFTPDGNAFNQKFRPIINCEYIGLHLTIYHRNQDIVYDSHSLIAEWDGNHEKTGEPLADGIYIYQISFMKPNGEIKTFVGFVLLLR